MISINTFSTLKAYSFWINRNFSWFFENINIVSKEDVPGFEALVVITALFLFVALVTIRRRK